MREQQTESGRVEDIIRGVLGLRPWHTVVAEKANLQNHCGKKQKVVPIYQKALGGYDVLGDIDYNHPRIAGYSITREADADSMTYDPKTEILEPIYKTDYQPRKMELGEANTPIYESVKIHIGWSIVAKERK